MPSDGAAGRRAGILAAGAVGLTGSATVWLGYLLWKVVPAYMARLADLGAPVPRAAAYVVFVSNWSVRLLPLLLLLSCPATVLVIASVATALGRKVPASRVFTNVAGLLLAVGVCELLAGVFVVLSLR